MDEKETLEILLAEYYLSIISKILEFRSNNGENKWTCENNRKWIDTWYKFNQLKDIKYRIIWKYIR